MHMADALLSPTVGGVMWAATGATTFYCSQKIKHNLDDRKIPLMGVMGAFVFAAQMINFAIPGTGSSGHLGGGLLLAVLLGPPAAFLVLASVLTVQALFFADGGLLALGANIFNLGFAPCFIAYPLIYKPLTGRQLTPRRLLVGTIAAAVLGLQIGSLGVVIETSTSGMLSLSFSSFLLLMQTIHLPIGLIEGLATAGVITFILKTRPEILATNNAASSRTRLPYFKVLAVLAVAAIITSGLLSWFASEKPDGLEWSLLNSKSTEESPFISGNETSPMKALRDKITLLPDYEFRSTNKNDKIFTDPRPDATISGLLGGTIVLILILLIGFLLKKKGETFER